MRLIVLLQAKNEERYLPGWLRNIEAVVDGIIALMTAQQIARLTCSPRIQNCSQLIRNKQGLEWDERANQTALVQAGRKHGADWLLCLDADERVEQTLIPASPGDTPAGRCGRCASVAVSPARPLEPTTSISGRRDLGPQIADAPVRRTGHKTSQSRASCTVSGFRWKSWPT